MLNIFYFLLDILLYMDLSNLYNLHIDSMPMVMLQGRQIQSYFDLIFPIMFLIKQWYNFHSVYD